MNDEEQKAHDEAVARAREANSKLNQDRLKRINEIADGSDEVRAADLDDADLKEARAAQEEADAKEYARRLQAEGAEPEEEEAPAVEAKEETQVASDTKMVNGELHYLQIVNGREKWQTLKEIRATASKVEAADEYLHNASEAVRNASRLAPSKDEPSKVEKVDLPKLLRAAVLGEEEAIDALASFLDTRPSEVTPDVVRTIDQRLSFRTELAELEAKSKDLLENPYTKRLFRDRLSELKVENPTMGLSEAYTSIDQELRTAFPGLTKTQTQDKLARKRTLVNVPTAASRQQGVEDEEGEEDVSTAIQKIAKARGGTPVIHGPRNR